MSNGSPFPFHYGEEADLYAFYRIPKLLFEQAVFQALSLEAKLLYGLMLDRMQLSIKNRWVDADGRIYIYFTIENVMRVIGCGNKKAGQIMAELDDKKGIGLITRERQGLGKPDKIFVHKCIPDAPVQRCENDTSGNVGRTPLELSKGHANNTEYNKTDFNENNLIYSEDRIERYEAYRAYFRKQLDYEILCMDYPNDQVELAEILELLVETAATSKDTIRVSGEEKPAQIVRGRLMKLNCEHIRYVMMCMNENTTHIRNIRQYLLAALYHAPVTMGNYYNARVNYDLYGKEGG